LVGKDDVHVDHEKIKAIQEWYTPKPVGEVRSFHDLTSFYRHLVQDFFTIATPLNDLVKGVAFVWGEK